MSFITKTDYQWSEPATAFACCKRSVAWKKRHSYVATCFNLKRSYLMSVTGKPISCIIFEMLGQGLIL